MLEEARKDFLAGRIQQEPLVLKAREVAMELGLLEVVEEAVPREKSGLTESLKQAEFRGEAGAANQLGIPSEKVLREEILCEEIMSEEDLLKARALEAVENLQQAVGGAIFCDALESAQQVSTGFSRLGDLSSIEDSTVARGLSKQKGEVQQHVPSVQPALVSPFEQVGVAGTGESSHVGTSGPTPPTPHPCDSSSTLAQQEYRETLAEHPTSKVTSLRTPLHGGSDQTRFELQAPALLNELLAHLKFNPDSRFPTKAQRKALLRRDKYCCRTPGCTNHLFLEIHHIKRYSQGGKTLPQFLVTLCSRCHKNTEEGKLYIRLSGTGQLIFTDQNGKDLERTFRLERAIWLDYWLGWKGTETDSHWARAVGFSDSAA